MLPSGPDRRSSHRRPASGPRHPRPSLPLLLPPVLTLLVLLSMVAGPLAAQPASPEAPPRLAPPPVELSGSFQDESSRTVYESIAEQAELAITFDPGLDHRAVSVDLAGLGAVEALDHVATLAGHYLAPVAERAVLVMADTPQNRRRGEPIGIRTFSLQHAGVADVMTALRSLTDARRLTATEDPPQVTLRDTFAKLAVGSRVVEMLDRQPWIVDLYVELLPVEAEVVTEIARDGGEISAEREQAIRARAGEPLAVGTLGLVGTGKAEWSGGRNRMVALSARSRLSTAERPVRLDLDLAVQTPGSPGGQGLRQHSSFQVADGATLALPLLQRDPGVDEPAASALLLVTPRIVERGRLDAEAVQTLYVGTETDLRVADAQ